VWVPFGGMQVDHGSARPGHMAIAVPEGAEEENPGPVTVTTAPPALAQVNLGIPAVKDM
jgi:hypothetical protein